MSRSTNAISRQPIEIFYQNFRIYSRRSFQQCLKISRNLFSLLLELQLLQLLERNIKQFPSNNSIYSDVRPDVCSPPKTADEWRKSWPSLVKYATQHIAPVPVSLATKSQTVYYNISFRISKLRRRNGQSLVMFTVQRCWTVFFLKAHSKYPSRLSHKPNVFLWSSAWPC